KIRGFRIELGEIENTLQCHPQIKQAVVLAKDDKAGNKRLIGYVVPNRQYNKNAVISFVESRLPDYMVPRMLMEMQEIPLTSNGKVDKKSLPNPDASDLIETVYVAPRDKVEETIIEVWKNLLQINKIGTHDNFFELGGNSLLAQNTIASLLKKEIALPITKIYQYPTAAGIAEFLKGEIKHKIQHTIQQRSENTDVAVIAMAGRFPGANTIEELWGNLTAGKESISF